MRDLESRRYWRRKDSERRTRAYWVCLSAVNIYLVAEAIALLAR